MAWACLGSASPRQRIRNRSASVRPWSTSAWVTTGLPRPRADWAAYVLPVLAEATLEVPDVKPAYGGGRDGVHSDDFSALLAEMAHLHLSHPGATW